MDFPTTTHPIPPAEASAPGRSLEAPAEPLDAVAPREPERDEESWPPPILLKLIGVGGAGVNIATRLSAEPLAELSLAVMDCDAQKLASSPIVEKCLLGERQRRGLSAGGDPELGRQAVEASREKIAAACGAADLVFLVVGLGGGTGSAAAAQAAAEAAKAGGLVIAFALLPFSFEGGRRVKQAEAALVSLRRVCDSVIVLPNDLLLQESAEGASALAAFEQASAWVARAVRAISGLLCETGLMNVDFAALQRAFEYRGSKTLFALGSGTGPGAAQQLLASLELCPLLHTPEAARRADRLLVAFRGSAAALTLDLINTVVQSLGEQFGRGAELIVGATLDDSLGERVELCLIGTSDIGNSSRRRYGVQDRAAGAVATQPAASGSAPTTGAGHAAGPAAPGGQSTTGTAATSREHTAGSRGADPALSPLVSTLPDSRLPSATKRRTHALTTAATELAEQDEFGFSDSSERGYFQDTDSNLFEGQDLDVPTFRRKGIKVTV